MVDDPGMSTAVAAIQTLLEFMNQNAGKLVVSEHTETARYIDGRYYLAA